MRVFYLFMAALLAAGFPADTLARTYFLPDYQSEFLYGNRVQDSDSGHHTSTPSCSDYGFYSAPQNNADCQRVSPPAPGLVCYSCTTCSADYVYDSSNCSGDYVTSGSSCAGKYSKCVCDRSKFPGSSSGGCPSGQKIDTSASCKGPSDTETYYQCVDDSCYGVILKNACETQGRYCVPSTKCPASCEQCIDRCEGYKSYEGAIECDNGCMNASDQISGCSGLCQAGSTCKPTTCDEGYELSGSTCVPKDCSGYLDACPDNAVCNDTCQSGKDTKYKPTGCKTGYADYGTFWCSVPQITACEKLGYAKAQTCSSKGKILRCPFDLNYTACIDSGHSEDKPETVCSDYNDSSAWGNTVYTTDCTATDQYHTCIATDLKDGAGQTCKFQIDCSDDSDCGKYFMIDRPGSINSLAKIHDFAEAYCASQYHGQVDLLLWAYPKCSDTGKLCLRCDA